MKYVDHAFNILAYCGVLVWLYLMCDVFIAFRKWLQFNSKPRQIDLKLPTTWTVKYADPNKPEPEPDLNKKKLTN